MYSHSIKCADGVCDPDGVGPILYCRGVVGDRLQLAALVAGGADHRPPALQPDAGEAAAPNVLASIDHWVLWRYQFSLPLATDAGYQLADRHFPVNAALDGDLRIGYVACNGMEEGDGRRSLSERNILWQRLAADHDRQPLQLLLHGGDQVYADEMLRQHPALAAWGRSGKKPDPATAFTDDMRQRARAWLFQRYLDLYSQPAVARLLARVPSLMMWDDHDICDGWGSLARARLDCPVGRGVFAVAREGFRWFQGACAQGEVMPGSLGPGADALGWKQELPGLSIIAPDLRSRRRPDQILDAAGWRALDHALSSAAGERVLFLSSVPVLGPRLSWLEVALGVVPRAQKYEDDLRDQWQSRSHRKEWRRLLRALLRVQEQSDQRLTLLSGEIHLATRGEIRSATEPMQQLVASGITHPPPPKAYALTLGALARLGEAPLPDHPIRLRPLPGRRAIYTAQRNYLLLERRQGQWSACWDLEHSGRTSSLAL